MHICQDLLLIPHLKASIKTKPLCALNQLKDEYIENI